MSNFVNLLVLRHLFISYIKYRRTDLNTFVEFEKLISLRQRNADWKKSRNYYKKFNETRFHSETFSKGRSKESLSLERSQ